MLVDILGSNLQAMQAAMVRYGMGSPLEQAHFLAQCAHESGGFRTLVESLSYSSGGLLRTWPRRFDAASAQKYARRPEAIANRVYANRLGNGDEASGDGWKFRGRGFLQTTGRDNYRAASMAICGDERLLELPELLEQRDFAALASAYFWNAHRLGVHAVRDDLEAVRRGVNGGLIGIDDCAVWLLRFKAALGVPV